MSIFCVLTSVSEFALWIASASWNSCFLSANTATNPPSFSAQTGPLSTLTSSFFFRNVSQKFAHSRISRAVFFASSSRRLSRMRPSGSVTVRLSTFLSLRGMGCIRQSAFVIQESKLTVP